MAAPRISKHFTVKELADELTGEVYLAKDFLVNLEMLREDYDHAMPVTDGCRTKETNEWLIERGFKASPNSFHLIHNPKHKTGGCCAIDMERPAGYMLHRLMVIATARRWSVGIGRTFVHLDRRVDFTELPAVIFTYD